MSSGTIIDRQTHRKLAIWLFNHVWELLDKTDRSQEEMDEMLHAAHASCYHWSLAGSAVNLVRGEWQISRVYSVLQRAEPAVYHARRCLDICIENQIGDFDLAFAYEALARASAVAGNAQERDRFLKLGHQAAEDIQEEEDRQLVLSDLKTIPV